MAHPTPCAARSILERREFLRAATAGFLAVVGTVPRAPLFAEVVGRRDARTLVRYPIPASDGVTIDKKHEVMICRAGNEVFAFALSCPHQNTALRALPGGRGFQCPRHKSRYQPNGTFIDGKATRNVDRLPISLEANQLVVDVDVAYESDREPAKWGGAVVKLS
jgi:nitrite reductase/ring-hydroxylating ferredoxin subunit